MKRASWWKETTRARLGLSALALGIALAFVVAAPLVSPIVPGRFGAILRPGFALALLAGLLLVAGNRLAAIDRRHDKRGE